MVREQIDRPLCLYRDDLDHANVYDAASGSTTGSRGERLSLELRMAPREGTAGDTGMRKAGNLMLPEPGEVRGMLFSGLPFRPDKCMPWWESIRR